MINVIESLVKDFEEGRIGRRQLIQSLALGLVGAAVPQGAAAQGGKGLKTAKLSHLSYPVSDYRRSRDFYAEVMGMKVTNDNGKTQCYMRFGTSTLMTRSRPNAKSGNIDHVSYMLEDWDSDRVRAELERHGLKGSGGQPLKLNIPEEAPEAHYMSFHTSDPDGFDIEISGIAKPSDSQYNAPPNVLNGPNR